MIYVPILFGSFNVRETSLDLYLFYLEVTKRGGYHQVYCSVHRLPHMITCMVLLYYIIYVASNQQGLNLAKTLVSDKPKFESRLRDVSTFLSSTYIPRIRRVLVSDTYRVRHC